MSTSSPPIHTVAAAECAIAELTASAWSPRPEPWPASAGSETAPMARTVQTADTPRVAVKSAPTDTIAASSAMTASARVWGISQAYVAATSGLIARSSPTPRISARRKNICSSASTAQMPEVMTARVRSRRPVGETVPPLPCGSRNAAPISQPTVSEPARSVSTRRVGSPQPTTAPGSGRPGVEGS